MATDDPLLPLAEIAAAALVTEAIVRRWVETGELQAETSDGDWKVRASVLESAQYTEGTSVRLAMGRARMHRFHAEHGEHGETNELPKEPSEKEEWNPAERLVPAERLTTVQDELAALHIPDTPSDFRADSAVDWPISVRFASPVEPARLRQVFDQEWAGQHRISMYGLPTAGGGWTYPFTSNPPVGPYAELQFAVSLHDDSLGVAPRVVLDSVLSQVVERCTEMGGKVSPDYPVEDAVNTSERLFALTSWANDNDDGFVSFSLSNEDGYPEEAVQELLLALGFVPWECDTFAWLNLEGCKGDDALISVANDDPTEVSFSFYVPRVAEPNRVCATALAVARTLQAAFGGCLTDEEGDPLDAEALNSTVATIMDRVQHAGLECGASAMRVL